MKWSRLELLPYHARIACSLSKVYKDVGEALVDRLLREMKRLHFSPSSKKKHHLLEIRTRSSRYMGELVKFGFFCKELGAPPSKAFYYLKCFFRKFQGSTINAACALLETVGMVLYRSAKYHLKMKHALETLMRHKKARNLTSIQEVLIDNAYFQVCPPTREEIPRRPRSKPELYIRHLLLFQTKSNTQVQTTARRMAFRLHKDPDLPVSKILMSVAQQGDKLMLAKVVCELSCYIPSVGVLVCEDVLEEIRREVLLADFRRQQKLVCLGQLLASLCTQRVCPLPVLLDSMYALMHQNHSSSVYEFQGASDAHLANPSVLLVPGKDPLFDCFRVTVLCAMLKTYIRHVRRNKLVPHLLTRFLCFFDRYVWHKTYVPMENDFEYLEVLEMANACGVVFVRSRSRVEANEKVNMEQGSVVVEQPLDLEGETMQNMEEDEFYSSSDEDYYSSESSMSDTSERGENAPIEKTQEDLDFEEMFNAMMLTTNKVCVIYVNLTKHPDLHQSQQDHRQDGSPCAPDEGSGRRGPRRHRYHDLSHANQKPPEAAH